MVLETPLDTDIRVAPSHVGWQTLARLGPLRTCVGVGVSIFHSLSFPSPAPCHSPAQLLWVHHSLSGLSNVLFGFSACEPTVPTQSLASVGMVMSCIFIVHPPILGAGQNTIVRGLLLSKMPKEVH